MHVVAQVAAVVCCSEAGSQGAHLGFDSPLEQDLELLTFLHPPPKAWEVGYAPAHQLTVVLHFLWRVIGRTDKLGLFPKVHAGAPRFPCNCWNTPTPRLYPSQNRSLLCSCAPSLTSVYLTNPNC